MIIVTIIAVIIAVIFVLAFIESIDEAMRERNKRISNFQLKIDVEPGLVDHKKLIGWMIIYRYIPKGRDKHTQWHLWKYKVYHSIDVCKEAVEASPYKNYANSRKEEYNYIPVYTETINYYY